MAGTKEKGDSSSGAISKSDWAGDATALVKRRNFFRTQNPDLRDHQRQIISQSVCKLGSPRGRSCGLVDWKVGVDEQVDSDAQCQQGQQQVQEVRHLLEKIEKERNHFNGGRLVEVEVMCRFTVYLGRNQKSWWICSRASNLTTTSPEPDSCCLPQRLGVFTSTSYSALKVAGPCRANGNVWQCQASAIILYRFWENVNSLALLKISTSMVVHLLLSKHFQFCPWLVCFYQILTLCDWTCWKSYRPLDQQCSKLASTRNEDGFEGWKVWSASRIGFRRATYWYILVGDIGNLN